MSKSVKSSRKKLILELSHDEARQFFLKSESYCSLDLPDYIKFDGLLEGVAHVLSEQPLSSKCRKEASKRPSVNYTILHNKDGKYAWRPFQLIHPALYVSLVHAITDKSKWDEICARFKEFKKKNMRIECLSIPVVSTTQEKDRAEQVFQWWDAIEQRSIELSLEYGYVLETDITDCYGSIYTHSIAWALHTKENAKKNRRGSGLIGNTIDAHIQDMRHGQTNGIPQGSVLMDFIAEMVLGLADWELSERIKKLKLSGYHVLRYRDDYRIFTNNPQDGHAIVKSIAETAAELGLHLNPLKTRISSDVVRAAVKSDKLAWIGRKQRERDLQKHLLIVHEHAVAFPNSGSLVRALSDYDKRLLKRKKMRSSVIPLIAIVVDIACRNPRIYSKAAAILSRLFKFLEGNGEKISMVKLIREKFKKIPNSGHMQIWLQRITYPIDRRISYDEGICRLVAGDSDSLWDNEWISSEDLKTSVDAKKIVIRDVLDNMSPVIHPKEVELFHGYFG